MVETNDDFWLVRRFYLDVTSNDERLVQTAMQRERIVAANGVDLCVERFGDPTDPPMLLIGNSKLSWDGELCQRLAAGARYVVRYDLRDTGRSTVIDPDAPTYSLRDLVGDAVGLLDALELRQVHVLGFGPGGWIAQLVALDHGDRVLSLTLVATRPTAPGPNDPDLPEHAEALMSKMTSAPEPEWSDRAASIDARVEAARNLAAEAGFDEREVRNRVAQLYDRTVGAAPDGVDLGAFHRANQMGTQFAALDSGARWRERLGSITAPTLVVHGDQDPFFPLGNGQALADEIPGAELVTLPGVGQELPRRAWDYFVDIVLRHTSGR